MRWAERAKPSKISSRESIVDKLENWYFSREPYESNKHIFWILKYDRLQMMKKLTVRTHSNQS